MVNANGIDRRALDGHGDRLRDVASGLLRFRFSIFAEHFRLRALLLSERLKFRA